MTSTPLVDIIVPTYGSEDFTINCFESIKNYTCEGTYNLIWVDNGSDRAKIEPHLTNIQHTKIFNETNEGFVKAVNKGILASTADYICLLNNDTIVSTDWLDKLISHLKHDKNLGIVGPLTLPKSSPGSQHSLLNYNILPGDLKSASLEEINEYLGNTFTLQSTNISFVAFFCAVIKREVIDKVGLLDENYAIGLWDDKDYNLAAVNAGYSVKLALDTCIYHKGRTTFDRIIEEESFDIEKILKANKHYLDQKWFGTELTIITRAIFDNLGDNSEVGWLSQNRLNIMQRYFINSLINQTDKNFTLCIILGEESTPASNAIENLNYGDLKTIFIYTSNLDEWRDGLSKKPKSMEILPGCPELLARNSNHPLTPIMVRIDSDDWVAPGWIAHIKHLAKTSNTNNLLINYQPIFQARDGRLFMKEIPFTNNRISPFVALIQQDLPRLSPYSETHFTLGSKFTKILTIPPGYCFSTIHGENRYNRFMPGDRFISDETVTSRTTSQPGLINHMSRSSNNHWRNRQTIHLGI